MPPSPATAVSAVDLARQARTTALVGVLPATSSGVGLAAPGLLGAHGPDAARFLHSQLTSDVEALTPGSGQLTARVTRTGHLRSLASLHREPDGSGFLFLMPAPDVADLHADLDGFLFADEVALTVPPRPDALAVQGPQAAEVLEAVLGPVGFEPWAVLPEGALREVRRARKETGLVLPEGTRAVRRSLGGDVGFLLLLPPGSEVLEPLARALAEAGATAVDAEAFSDALEILRLEAGLPRVGPETAGRKRLLPETGLEQLAVSYTKGCYLGQEVIARVRTYGSVPHLLRALRLTEGREDPAHPVLSRLPEPGDDLVDAVTGKKLGQAASRAWSPVAGGPVLLAYLGRDHRAPGEVLTFQGTDGAPVEARVAVLPLYSAPDAAARVQQLYDRAIRTFADGDEPAAIALMEESLRLDPGFGDAYEAIGVMLGRANRFHEAIDVFRRLEEVAPDEPLVNTNLSLYYMKLGDKETAEDEAGKSTIKQMAKARGKQGAGATADADLAKAKAKDAARKRGMFEQVLEFDPVDPIALFGLGTALLTLGEPSRAAEVLEKAVEVDRNNSPVYAARGKALEAVGRVDEAVEVYREGVKVASRKGDLMPLKEMEHRLLLLGGR